MKFKNTVFLMMFIASTSSNIFSYPVSYTRLINPRTHQVIHLIGDIHIFEKDAKESEEELLRILHEILEPEKDRSRRNIPIKTKLIIEADYEDPSLEKDANEILRNIHIDSLVTSTTSTLKNFNTLKNAIGGLENSFLPKLYKNLKAYEFPVYPIYRGLIVFCFLHIMNNMHSVLCSHDEDGNLICTPAPGIKYILNTNETLNDSIDYILRKIRAQYQDAPKVLETVDKIYKTINKKDEEELDFQLINIIAFTLDHKIISTITSDNSTKNIIVYAGLMHTENVAKKLIEEHGFLKIRSIEKIPFRERKKEDPLRFIFYSYQIHASSWMPQLRDLLMS